MIGEQPAGPEHSALGLEAARERVDPARRQGRRPRIDRRMSRFSARLGWKGRGSAQEGGQDRGPEPEGSEHEDLAARIGRAVKTVVRTLEVVRRFWLEGADQS
jgi:hypothetical protein